MSPRLSQKLKMNWFKVLNVSAGLHKVFLNSMLNSLVGCFLQKCNLIVVVNFSPQGFLYVLNFIKENRCFRTQLFVFCINDSTGTFRVHPSFTSSAVSWRLGEKDLPLPSSLLENMTLYLWLCKKCILKGTWSSILIIVESYLLALDWFDIGSDKGWMNWKTFCFALWWEASDFSANKTRLNWKSNKRARACRYNRVPVFISRWICHRAAPLV